MRIALLLWLMACSVQGQALYESLLLLNAPVGAGCTHNTGNITNESFEGSDQLTWTDTGTVDRSAALAGTSPCSGLGSQCLEINWDGSATRPYATWDRGSTINATLYWGFYFYIVSHSTVDTDKYAIFKPCESSPVGVNEQFRVEIINTSGQIQVRAVTGASASTAINVSTATWYHVKVKYINNSTGGSEFKLFDAADSQIDTTKNWDTANNFFQFLYVGLPAADDTKAFRVQIDGITVDDSGYLGQ